MNLALPSRTYQFSLAGRPTSNRSKSKKARPRFEPTEQQVATATKRIVGYMRRHGGSLELPRGVEIDTLARQVAAKLFSRDCDLGNPKYGEVTLTVLVAMRQMLNTGEAVLDEGFFALKRPLPPKRVHAQKYPKGYKLPKGRRYAA